MRIGIKAVLTACVLTLVITSCASEPPGPSGQPLPEEEPAPTSEDSGSASPFDQTLACLPGKWEVDRSSEFWDIAAGSADEVSGTFYIMFDPAGGYVVEYDSWRIFTHVNEDIGYSTEVVWDGSVTGEYTVGDDGRVETTVIDSGATVTSVTETSMGVDKGATPVGDPIPMFYQCDGDQILGFVKGEAESGSPHIIYNLSERLD
jgi:hypothetical protein